MRTPPAPGEPDAPTLAEIMEQHPQLNTFGIGVFDSHRKAPAQRQADLAAGRVELAAREASVLETAAWLSETIAPIKTPTVSSYGMKHVMERATGRYVTNGEFIAAAIIAGYPLKFTDGPNVLFGMSARDIQSIEGAP